MSSLRILCVSVMWWWWWSPSSLLMILSDVLGSILKGVVCHCLILGSNICLFFSFWLYCTLMSTTFSCLSLTDLNYLLKVQLHFWRHPSTTYGDSLFSLLLQLFPALYLSPKTNVPASCVQNIAFSAFWSWLLTKCLISLSAKFLCFFCPQCS